MVSLEGEMTNFSLPMLSFERLFGLGMRMLSSFALMLRSSFTGGWSSAEMSAKNCLYGPPSPTTCSPLKTIKNARWGSFPVDFYGRIKLISIFCICSNA